MYFRQDKCKKKKKEFIFTCPGPADWNHSITNRADISLLVGPPAVTEKLFPELVDGHDL